MKKIFLTMLATGGSLLPAFAEGEANAGADFLSTWVNTAQTTMDGWSGKLAPLFGIGVTLMLMFIAFRLFKRTGNKAV